VQLHFIEFLTANIRNRNTRRAYAQAVGEFLNWGEDHRCGSSPSSSSSLTTVARRAARNSSML